MNILNLNPNQIKQYSAPYGSRKYVGFKGTDLLIRLSDGRVISHKYELLTDIEYEIAQNALNSPVERPFAQNPQQMDYLWARAAIISELEAIGRCQGDNPHRPDSEFWACLIKIASVLKGSGRQHIPVDKVRTAVLQYAPLTLKTKGDRIKDISYLFGRAMNQAMPRYRIKTQ